MVPAQQYLWSDKEHPPSVAVGAVGSAPRQRTVGGFQARPRVLAAQHRQLLMNDQTTRDLHR
jgi:hypothetical protein